MKKVDLIIHNAKQLVTCSSDGKAKKGKQMQDVGIIEDGAVAVVDELIEAVGKSDEILNEFESEDVFDAKQKSVTPGFVECHTHIIYAGDRIDEFELKIKGAEYLEILESGGGILSTVKKTREASLEELVKQSKKRLDKMFELGVTTCEVKTGYGLDTETELKMLGAILKLNQIHPINLIPTLLAAHAVPPEFQGKSDEYVDLICDETIPFAFRLYAETLIDSDEIHKKFENNSQGTADIGAYKMPESEWVSRLQNNPMFIDVFCEKNAFNLEQSKRVLETGKRFGLKIKAHVDEFTNLGCAKFAIENGATSIDHLDATSDAEIKMLADSDTIGVITPTVNFNFGSTEFADARKMIDAGCAIAVSTDYNPGSAPCPSLPNAMAIACRYQKLLPSEAINAATINAAFAVGMGSKIGSLEVGKQADILILKTSDYRELVYEFGGNLVEKVIKNGKLTTQN